MKSLEDWNIDYLKELAALGPEETANFEKKAALAFSPQSASTRDEIAKQVCAFANASGGYLVYGLRNDGSIDEGVITLVGRQSVKDWVEAIIPRLLTPQVTGCQAKVISDPKFHEPGRGVLVVEVPPSESRPHWMAGRIPEVAYLRVGAHSGPMSLQTFRDISNRSASAVVDIVEVDSWDISPRPDGVFLNPRVVLVRGSLVETWTFVVKIPPQTGMIVSEWATNAIEKAGDELNLLAYQPLFPGNPTLVARGSFGIALINGANPQTLIEMTIYAPAARPVKKSYSVAELKDLASRKRSRSELNGFSTKLHSDSISRSHP